MTDKVTKSNRDWKMTHWKTTNLIKFPVMLSSLSRDIHDAAVACERRNSLTWRDPAPHPIQQPP